MSDNMCEHGGLDGNCLRCKDATITRLDAEIAALRARCEAAEWKVEKAREAMKSPSSTYSVFDKLKQILE